MIPTDELIVFRGVGLNHQPDGNIHFSSSEEFIAINIFMDYSWVLQIWAWDFVWFPWWFPQKTMVNFTDRDDPTGASPPGLTGASPSALATTRTSWTAWKLGVGRQLKWGGTLKIRHKQGNSGKIMGKLWNLWENHGTSSQMELYLVGGLEHLDYFSHSVGHNHPNWLSYVSEGLKPPTRVLKLLIIKHIEPYI